MQRSRLSRCKRDQLGALLEQGVAPIGLEVEVVFDGGGEGFVGLRAQIVFGEGAAEAKLLLGLARRPADWRASREQPRRPRRARNGD